MVFLMRRASNGHLRKMAKAIWKACWGSVRLASEAWTWASILPMSANPISRWFSDSATQIWYLGNSPRFREMMLELWPEEVASDRDGIWSVFAFLIQGIGAQRIAGGRVLLEERILLDVNLSLQHWQHQIRGILRIWWSVQGPARHWSGASH